MKRCFAWMDEKQAVFEQLALRQFKIWSSTASRILNNYSITMTNNSRNKKKVMIVALFSLLLIYELI